MSLDDAKLDRFVELLLLPESEPLPSEALEAVVFHVKTEQAAAKVGPRETLVASIGQVLEERVVASLRSTKFASDASLKAAFRHPEFRRAFSLRLPHRLVDAVRTAALDYFDQSERREQHQELLYQFEKALAGDGPTVPPVWSVSSKLPGQAMRIDWRSRRMATQCSAVNRDQPMIGVRVLGRFA
jgi:hypothetical protein